MAYWLCQILGWGLWSALNGLMYASYGGTAGGRGITVTLWMGVVGLGTSHLLRAWIRRRHWADLSPARATPRLVAAAIVLSVGTSVLNWAAMIWLFQLFRLEETRWQGFVSSALIWIAVYLLWVGIYFSVKYFERYRQAEVERLRLEMAATEAQLRLLRAQVNPHFLFNSLNSIRGLILEDPSRAQEAITELSQLLRYSLQSDRSATVPLAEEVAAVADYLRLEKIRLEDRLHVDWMISEDCRSIRVPPMLIQTLVENAIKHGIAQLPGGGMLRVHASHSDGTLRLKVENPGRYAPNGSGGIGLKNARDRLRLLYNGRASVEVEERNGEVIAEVCIPE